MTTNRVFLKILIVALIYIIVSCKEKNDSSTEEEIVLQIDTFKITRYEYEKMRNNIVHQQKKVVRNTWLKKYIGNAYFLADAYNRKYDTSKLINKKVNYAAISMLCKYKGYLWDKIEEPKLISSDEELKAAYTKQNKIFQLEYFVFENKGSFDAATRIVGEIRTEAVFRKLINSAVNKRIPYRKAELYYPFNDLSPLKDEIYQSKSGALIQCLIKNGKGFIIYVNKIENREQQPFEAEKPNILANLRHIQETQIIENTHDSIFRLAKIYINENAAREISKNVSGFTFLNKSKISKDDKLASYNLNHQRHTISVTEFADYYQNNPFSLLIKNVNGVKETLKAMLIEKYLYVRSEKLGLLKEKKFILDRKNFKNRLILDYYTRDNFYNVKLSDSAILNYYQANRQKFTSSKVCKTKVLIFNDRISADYNLDNVERMIKNGATNFSDTSSLKGLLRYEPSVLLNSIDYSYPAYIVSDIFFAKLNSAIGPYEYMGHGFIFIKTYEEGQEPQPLELVKETLKRDLITKAIEISTKRKLNTLRRKYRLVVNKLIPE